MSDPSEAEMIQQLGGTIIRERLSGLLNISRFLGDGILSKSTCIEPFNQEITVKKCDQILLGCDGIFDFLSNEDCSQLISQLKTQQMQQLESVMNHINADLVTILQQSSLKSPNNLSQFYIDCIKLIIIFDDSIFQ